MKSSVLIADSISEELRYEVLANLYWTCANYTFSRHLLHDQILFDFQRTAP